MPALARRALVRLALVLAVLAAGHLLLVLTGAPAPAVPSSPTTTAQAPAATPAGQDLACWTEPKTDGNPPEGICGPRRLAPADAYAFHPYH